MAGSMKKIFAYLRDYTSAHFHPGYYGAVAVFLAAAFTYNYAVDFKRSVMNAHPGEWIEVFNYCLYYALPYYAAVAAYVVFCKDHSFIKSRVFWLTSAAMILALALNRSALVVPLHIVRALEAPPALNYFIGKVLVNFVRTIAMFTPIWLYKRLFENDREDLYGLGGRGFDWRPYIVMLGIMTPLIIWASFQPSFLRAYPTYRPGAAEQFLNVSPWITFIGYELTYAMRFITVELFFRGFLVIGMVRLMGKGVLLPMVTLYAFWHFGKPFGEALGSVFGAYILGIIALYSRNIWGGVFIHMGVAALMDITAYLQLYVIPK